MKYSELEPRFAAAVRTAFEPGKPSRDFLRPASVVPLSSVRPGAAPRGAKRSLVTRAASNIEPRDIDFLWEGRLARGKQTCIGGEPGAGKSTLTIAIIATITRGGLWPCGEGRAPVGSVIILSAEDDPEDVTVPRLIAAGADLAKVHIVTSVAEPDGKRSSFNLQADLALLEQKIDEIGDVVLVIIDPVSSYMGKVDSHKNAEVRGVLEPITEMAAHKRVAILSVTHFSKAGAGGKESALNRFIGSIAFVGAPRAAFAVIADAELPGRVLLLHAKTNMGRPCQGLAFRLEAVQISGLSREVARVSWEGEAVNMTANEALRARNDSEGSAKADAERFLYDLLAGGPVPTKEIQEAARAHSISAATLRRAQESVGARPQKDGLKGWVWSL
jgi:putative DNA primase/helicase